MRAARHAAFGVLAVLALCAARPARAQFPEPVTVSSEGIFGSGSFLPNGYGTVLVTLHNNTTHTLRGLAYAVESGGSSRLRHEAPVDLPPRATRIVPVQVFNSANGSSFDTGFTVDGDVVGRNGLSTDYSSGARSLVLLLDPLRLRGNVLDIEVDENDERGGGGVRTMRIPLGIARVDPATGDPLLPERPESWSSVKLFVASAPLLARASPEARTALLGWLRAGGRLLIVPRTDADLRDPNLRELMGDVARGGSAADGHTLGLVPAGVRAGLECGQGVRAESFGCGHRIGFGRVWTSSYDLNASANATTPQARELVRALLGLQVQAGIDAPLLHYGADEEQQTDSGLGGFQAGTTFGVIRSALDPNEGYTPALGIAALLLLVYVVLVGPVNFTWIGRRNKPTLALVTTPIVAMGAMAMLLAVGYLGKGVRMRYRRVALVEVMEGERIGPSRRYTGLFLTHPSTFDVPSPADGVVTMVPGTGTDAPPSVDHSVDPPRLRSMRGRLWETLFLREDREVDLGGAVTFVRNDRTLAYVENHSTVRLRDAIVVDQTGGVYVVGDVPAGGRTAIARSQSHTVNMPSAYYTFTDSDPQWEQLAHDLGVDPDEKKIVMGLAGLLNGSLVTAAEPTLFARIDDGRRATDVAGFGMERDITFVRVVPAWTDVPVSRAAPPTSPSGGTPTAPTFDDDTDEGSGGDAGADDVDADVDAGPAVDPALGVDPFAPPAAGGGGAP